MCKCKLIIFSPQFYHCPQSVASVFHWSWSCSALKQALGCLAQPQMHHLERFQFFLFLFDFPQQLHLCWIIISIVMCFSWIWIISICLYTSNPEGIFCQLNNSSRYSFLGHWSNLIPVVTLWIVHVATLEPLGTEKRILKIMEQMYIFLMDAYLGLDSKGSNENQERNTL